MNQDNIYQVYSFEKGDELDDFWFDLSKNRKLAFDRFKLENFADEVESLIDRKQNEDGEVKTKDFIEMVKNSYRGNYAQINISDKDLREEHFRDIADLVRSEIRFVRGDL